MIYNQYVKYGIILIIILLLMNFMGCFSELSLIPTGDESESFPSTKLHGGQASVDHALWDICCEGYKEVTFYHEWDYYHSDSVYDEDIIWRVRDSKGGEVYYSAESSPERGTESLRGYWDCIRPWTVVIVNTGAPPINYEWKLTLSCE